MKDEYIEELKEKFPRMDSAIVNEIADYISTKVFETMEPIEIDPNKLYVVNIYTGAMPKPKAEKHLKEWLKLFKESNASVSAETRNVIVTSYNDSYDGVKVISLDKDKSHIIYYDAGNMSDAKLDAHTESINKISDDLNEKGYVVKFVRKHKGEIISVISE